MPKVLVAYYSKTGNTKQVAEAIVKGAKSVKGVTVEVKKIEDINAKEAVEADAFAFGSPSYFSIMSGPLLTLLTEFYFVREKLEANPWLHSQLEAAAKQKLS
jgi:NAD(P)H dehydrogenase (quinone)